jgi:PucR family transcriptional regulator, purine catabolism regulatory protein
MTITIAELVDVPGLSLRLVAGREASDRPVRWVHVSELEDPTPWLRGGELLLTTGMGLGATPARQRGYVDRLAGAGVAGLGLGLGFSHRGTPHALAAAAEKARLPLVEVPYAVPFIALTEAVFSRLAREQFEQLQRALDAEHELTRAVLDDNGVEGVARSLAAAVRGWALVVDLHGTALAATSRSAESRRSRVWNEIQGSRPDGARFSLTLVDRGHHVWVQPVAPRGRVEAFLAIGKREAATPTDRIVAGHAVSLIAIELAKSRAIADAERRLQGDFFDELASGGMGEGDIARGLGRFGFAPHARVRVVSVEGADPAELADIAGDVLSREPGAYLVSPHARGIHVLQEAAGGLDLASLGDALRAKAGPSLLLGAGSVVAPGEVAKSAREAAYALRVCRLENRREAGFDDLGSYRLLLSMADPGALRAFADSLLGPLDAYDGANGGDLRSSLVAFLENNARWETAAAQLYVHRHTLRYRMRKVEELTGRDLASSFDRMEFWLALRGRQLLAEDVQDDPLRPVSQHERGAAPAATGRRAGGL